MRQELKKIKGVRTGFTATFERVGQRKSFGYVKKTILVRDVKDAEGKTVTDHLWFNLTKGFASLGLAQGDVVQFDARVNPYEKGYKGCRDDVYKPVEIDYKL